MPLLFQKMIYREDLKYNRHVCFVFGDNDAREGLGGQAAAMRGEPNAIGIRTKKAPTHRAEDYYTDNEFDENTKKIVEDFAVMEKLLYEGKTVVFPLDGVGTGIANLRIYAPRTLDFINQCVHLNMVKYHR